ncbi:MAG: hypothetical protein P1U89_22820 [Verrucomicrobiales bacterium]|nr:hypothetical protein [Verrucomicrobiales bacterium]
MRTSSMTQKPSNEFDLHSDTASEHLSERISAEIEALEKGQDRELLQAIEEGLEYRPMSTQGELTPRQRYAQLLGESTAS